MLRTIKEKKYNYFYKITNLINGHFYYGIHSTDNLNDGYMGSGTRLNNAYKKYGIENFNKEILKFFDNRESLSNYEAEIVTESLVHDPDCYNISCGGEAWKTIGTVSVRDSSGNIFRCDENDPKYLSGEYTPITKGLLVAYDLIENCYVQIDRDTYDKNKERYTTAFKNKIYARRKDSSIFEYIDTSEYNKNKSVYLTQSSNKFTAIDKDGKYFMVDKNDPRIKTGELKHLWFGRHHTDETKNKISEHHKSINFHKGEDNPQYGTCWVSKEYKSIRIKKEDLEKYLNNGYTLGRHIKHPDECYENKIVTVKCEVCGKSYETKKKYTYGNRHRTCSHECAVILLNRTRSQSNKIDPRNKIVGEIEDRVRELRKQGLTAKAIAEDIKVASKATVSRFLKNNGL